MWLNRFILSKFRNCDKKLFKLIWDSYKKGNFLIRLEIIIIE
jgi:hypothetical protein